MTFSGYFVLTGAKNNNTFICNEVRPKNRKIKKTQLKEAQTQQCKTLRQ